MKRLVSVIIMNETSMEGIRYVQFTLHWAKRTSYYNQLYKFHFLLITVQFAEIALIANDRINKYVNSLSLRNVIPPHLQ